MIIDKTKNNMYNWITKTYNPLGGICPHACDYCYVKSNHRPVVKKKYSGKPYLVEHELKKSLGKDNFIFVCSMMDLFADDIEYLWLEEIVRYCMKYDNQYLFQSKNPKRMFKWVHHIKSSDIMATTIETNRHYLQMGKAPPVNERSEYLSYISQHVKTIVTCEPIMNFDLDEMTDIILMCNPEWVNIGADSKGHNLPEPSTDKIKDLISNLKNDNIEVKLKSNLKRLMK